MDKRVLRERMRKKQQQIRRRQMMKKGAYVVAVILVFIFVIRGIILPVINRVGGKNTDKPAQVQAETDTNANTNTGDSGTETQIEKDTNAAIRKPLKGASDLTKASQLPFSTWLVGAMVAPTPSSALLHSATMVKAGIYILFRLAPGMSGTETGLMVSLVGGFTFFIMSIFAVEQTDGKKVLAFSTLSNLGLMTACAGVGVPATVWAGVFLMVFHAVSKSLLFQDIGATENSLHTRNIEDFGGLLHRLPKLASCMFIGIVGMFLAPFGMLFSKWATLKSVIDSKNIILVLLLCFGSATTTLYWSKWLGKLIQNPSEDKEVKDVTKTGEYISLYIHTAIMIAVTILIPTASLIYVNPLVTELFGTSTDVMSKSVLYTMVAMLILAFLVPFLAYLFTKNQPTKVDLTYMNGVNSGDNKGFVNAFGETTKMELGNYYFDDTIKTGKMMKYAQIALAVWIVVMTAMAIVKGGAF